MDQAIAAAIGLPVEQVRADLAAPTVPVLDPTLVEWPGTIACPYRPLWRQGPWYVFEERYPPRGHGPVRLFLSDHQIDHGEVADPLNLRQDWLAMNFPGPDGGFEEWDVEAVAAWLRHHIATAQPRRRGHGARQDDPVRAEAPPAPRKFAFECGTPLGQTNPIPRMRSVAAERGDDGRVTLAVTFLLPNHTDVHALRQVLPPSAAADLAAVLLGDRR